MTGWLTDFGDTGIRVSRLGYGGGHIGGGEITDGDAVRLLHCALDLGITLFDTARGYGVSEERMGRAFADRRERVVLSTKIGYGVSGIPDWTAAIISAGVTEALRKLQTDRIDIVHLHSCPLDTLRNSGVVEVLAEEKKKGRIRCAAYSGDNDALAWAAANGAFDSLQCSINICDQHALEQSIPAARESGKGVIAKRPLANAPWKFSMLPAGQYVETYWRRFEEMGMRGWGVDWEDAALRFASHLPGVHSCIVGTRNEEHLRRNIETVRRGPLPAELESRIRASFASHAGWRSET